MVVYGAMYNNPLRYVANESFLKVRYMSVYPVRTWISSKRSNIILLKIT